MCKKYPYYSDSLPQLIRKDGVNMVLYFYVKSKEYDIKKYLDFRNKLKRIGYYHIDSDTGIVERKKFDYLYFWVYSDEYNSNKLDFNYDDYISNLEYEYPEFLMREHI